MGIDSQYHIFSDISFDPKSKAGVAGFLIVSALDLVQLEAIQTKIVEDTTCTRLEIQSILWALDCVRDRWKSQSKPITLYTDCKTVCDLEQRRKKLEATDYKSKKTGLPLNNADLYRQFFAVCDELDPKIFWVKGHLPRHQHDSIQKIFSEVDRSTRRELRQCVLRQ